MKRLFTLVIGIALGGVIVFGAQHYHLLRTDEGFYLIPKTESTFTDCYVDVRNFGVSDWIEHRPLAVAIVKAKKDHLLKDTSLDNFRDGLGETVDGLLGEAREKLFR